MDPTVPPPRLIHDLERLVFTLAYKFSNLDPRSLSNLLLVCHRVHDWLEPYRFQFLHLSRSTISKCLQLLSQKSPSFISTHVLSIMDICGSCPPRDTIFRMCTGIEDLYLGLLGVVCSDTFPDLNQFPQLRRLSLRGYTRSFAHEVCSQNSPSLRSLTHLHWGWEYKERGQGFPPIKQMIQNLPTLSHFSIQWDHRKSFWDGISELANLDQLKVIGVIRLLGIMSVVLDAERVPVEWMSVLGERKVILMGLGADDEMDEGEERIWWDPIEHYAEYWAIMPAETPAEAQKKPDWLEQFTAYS